MKQITKKQSYMDMIPDFVHFIRFIVIGIIFFKHYTLDELWEMIAAKSGKGVGEVQAEAKKMEQNFSKYLKNFQSKFPETPKEVLAKQSCSKNRDTLFPQVLHSKKPDKVTSYTPTTCSNCNHTLADCTDQSVAEVHEIVELKTFHFHRHRCQCNKCGYKTEGEYPTGLKNIHHGPNFTTTVAKLAYVDGLSYGNITKYFKEKFNYTITGGALANMFKRLGRLSEKSQAKSLEFFRNDQVVSVFKKAISINGEIAFNIMFQSRKAVACFADFKECEIFVKTLGMNKIPTTMIAEIPVLLESNPIYGQVCLDSLHAIAKQIHENESAIIGGELVELVEDIMTLAKNIEMLHPNVISQHCQELSRRCTDIVVSYPYYHGTTFKLLNQIFDANKKNYLLNFALRRELKISPYRIEESQISTALGFKNKVRTVFKSFWGAKAAIAIRGYIFNGIINGITPFESIRKLVFDNWKGPALE